MNATSSRIRFAAATAAVAITLALLHSVCAIADHGAAVQIAAAKNAHPTVVAFGR